MLGKHVYEHQFHHAVVDFMKAVDTGGTIEPNFYDGLRTMQILEAALKSAESGQKVQVPANF